MVRGQRLDPYLAWCIDRAALVAGRAMENRLRKEWEESRESQKYMGSGMHDKGRKVQHFAPRPKSGVEYNERKQTISGELPFIGKRDR